MKLIAYAAMFTCLHAAAQSRVETFPPDSTAADTPALQASLAGKTFLSDKLANKGLWKVVFDAAGGFTFIDVPSGWTDAGKWSDAGGKICGEGKATPVWCNEVQIQGERIFLKTKMLGVVPLKLQQ